MVQETLQPLAFPQPVELKIKKQESVGEQFSWQSWLMFTILHLAALSAIWVGWSWSAIGVAFAMYYIRMFAITAFYHRYFSHRAFKTSRFAQFVFAIWGSSACQQGPLWWAAHHRHHHHYSDQPEDLHSPRQQGFLISHIGWITQKKNQVLQAHRIPDLMKYPELVWLDKNNILAPVALATAMYVLGVALEIFFPASGTNGIQMLIWGFFVSTVCLYHGTFTINSLSHQLGSQRYPTGDDSRNNLFFALLTMGEGWHNNHHYYATSARQGFYWWEIDLSFYLLWLMSKAGIVWDLKKVPAHIRKKHR